MVYNANARLEMRVNPDVKERAEARAWLERDSLTEIVRAVLVDYGRGCSDETLASFREHRAALAARRSG